MELVIDGVDVFNPLKGKMDQIKEYFIQYYGEKYRAKIEENFASTKFFFVPTNGLNELGGDINMFFRKKQKEIENELYAQFTDEPERISLFSSVQLEDILGLREMLKNNEIPMFFNRDLVPALKFLKIVKSRNDLINEELERRGISSDNFDEKYAIGIKIREPDLSKEQLEEILDNPENNAKLDKFLKDLEDSYNNDGFKDRLDKNQKENEDALKSVEPIDEKIKIAKRQNEERTNQFVYDWLKGFIDEKELQYEVLSYSSLLETFKDGLNVDLNHLGNYQKNKFVKLFKHLGFDLGDSLKDYINDPTIREKILDEEHRTKFKEMQKQNKLNLANSNEIFQSAINQIQELDLEGGSLDSIQNLYSYMKDKSSCAGAYVQVAAKTKEGETVNIFVCPWAINGNDKTVFHEFGHIFEASVIEENDNEVISTTGFDITTSKRRGKDYDGENLLDDIDEANIGDRPRRPYEAINEIINDYLTDEIYDNFQKDGLFINVSEDRDGRYSSYRYGFKLLRDFINQHKQELIDARMSGDVQAYKRAIGEENFEALAKASERYLSLTSNFSRHKAFIDDVKPVMERENCSFHEAALMPKAISEGSYEFIEQHQIVEGVNKAISKSQNQEDNEKGD